MGKFRFTEASIRKIAPPAKGRERHSDSETKGLALRVSATGARVLYHYSWQPGTRRPVDIRLDAVGAITLDRAREIVQSQRGLMANGVDLGAEQAQRRQQPTLQELVDDYFEWRTREGHRGVDGDRAHIWELWLGELPDVPPKKHGRARRKPAGSVNWSQRRVGSITREEIRALVRAVIKQGKRRTAGRVHELLHAAFAWGARNGRVAANPATGIDAPNSEERERFARTEELPALLKAIQQTAQPWRDFFTILLFVGFRRSPVQAMCWTDIDFENQCWLVPRVRSKNKEPLVIALSGPALQILKRRATERAADCPWVFPGGSRDGHIGRPKQAWDSLLTRAGIAGLRPHDLRRTLGSFLAMENASLPMIGRVLGHKDQKSTAIYARFQLAPVHKALEKAHAAIRKAGRRKTRG